ncbi:Family of unknown function (DUF648) [Chlamydia serpentis]|uniref:Uncharacterized protein n=1 Tax=Chlamydia serpentis TaxID=1967782 RepID=A0A2R8FAB5_9CHLA|nr:DUF648 domain-containing protein [Chlamydia serpentis]SPN73359.1 Family of unknown function (DUF648) [Chlamydia serpentis]
METYSFSSGMHKSSALTILEKLESYFFLGGQRTQIIVLTSDHFKVAIKKEATVSTINKILKILSFILLPIVLIALAIRFFLRASLLSSTKCLFIPTPISKEEEFILAANPEAVKQAAINAPAVFCMPKKYRKIKIELFETRVPEITFAVDLDILEKDISLKEFRLPTKCIDSPLLEFGTAEEQALIKSIQAQEKDNTYVSEKGKNQLLRLMLEQIFVHGVDKEASKISSLGRTTWFPSANPPFTLYEEQRTMPNSIWYHIFFLSNSFSRKEQLGYCILKQLEKLGMSGKIHNIYPTTPPTIAWEKTCTSILLDKEFMN